MPATRGIEGTTESAGTAAQTVTGTLVGTVLRAVSGFYDVQPDLPGELPGGPPLVRCRLRDRLRKELLLTESKAHPQRVREVRRLSMVEPVVAGDRVRFLLAPTSGAVVPQGVIEEVLPRTRELTRQAVTDGAAPVGQTLAANHDQVMLVFAAAEPAPALGLVDRFLVSCEWAGLPAIVTINKCDLGIDPDLGAELAVYERIGYRLLRTSATHGQGLDELRDTVQGKISTFVGPSGVGKSSLLNALEPGLGLRVGEISAATGKGRHTTPFAQLFPLRGGGFVADTPGLRQLALWAVPADVLDQQFRELRPYLGRCRFGNCAHVGDQGCAVKEAVARGEIHRRRYISYVKLFTEG